MDGLDPRAVHASPEPVTDEGQGAFPGTAPTGTFDPWRYRDESGVTGADLVGYQVEATDGSIGKIDEASHEVNASYLVVETGPWIFGRTVVLPAGTVSHVDHGTRTVHVDRSRDQIKAAPEYDATDRDPAFRNRLGGYYDDTYAPVPPGTAR
ncbi:PRC-barrel domain containing protein [Micromonospora cathayae]|uniref:PRC-barrel domain containing protein n=1 Tax=Micromonospora cathayae TaxID=3028804 RepID=A0ABY7ZX27_9ACTN|nr:PRC-barrel domain containing protein [Micromonospora sp. HUAS 3]WDZ87376.1 PRC-barrel domain containing protein [Micromonospora sp. HUAS 3]